MDAGFQFESPQEIAKSVEIGLKMSRREFGREAVGALDRGR